MKIHHIGYLVKKLDKARSKFTELGYVEVSPVIRDEYREIDILFIEKDGYRIELVSAYTSDSVISGLHKKLGNNPYHICYETDDFEKDLSELENSGYVCYDEPHSAIAFDNRRVVFLINPYMGMIELVET